MILASQFKEGNMFINENGQTVEVMTVQHHRKSQARAVVRVKLKNVETGSIIETAYRPEDKFKDVQIEKRPKTYVYSDGGMAYFMDDQTFEQAGLPLDKLVNTMKFLTENMPVEGLYLNGSFFSVQLPANLIMEITETVEGVRGNTVSNVMKLAKVSTGLEIQVPMFIKEGDKVRVDTRNMSYVERYTEPKK
ncbi:MAG: elongation factor P [Elusimicrobia bacterium GWA2_61_42]|nr:MAG: elongation factor P [Elusimicrobia bacterium GWA2_61_42]OGR78048.1 MAG: elongation factor P [Elusimicrobia bacterium GWC2_61_25]